MPLVGFKPTISAGERPQTYALDRAATGADHIYIIINVIIITKVHHKILNKQKLIIIIIIYSWLHINSFEISKGKVILLQARCGPEGE